MKRNFSFREQPRLEVLEERFALSAVSGIFGALASTNGSKSCPAFAQSAFVAAESVTATKAAGYEVPFKVNGGGTAPYGIPVVPGLKAPHNATGIASHLGKYVGNEGELTLLSIDFATLTGTFRGTYVFVAANGDRLAFNYGATPGNPGVFSLKPTASGEFVATFVAEFTPDAAHSTGRFAKVTGGSFKMVATSEPFLPVPSPEGFTPPFAYTWVGEGKLEFSRGSK